MKNLIIAAAVIISTAFTALSVAKSFEIKPVKVVKIDKTDFLNKGFSSQKSDISSAD